MQVKQRELINDSIDDIEFLVRYKALDDEIKAKSKYRDILKEKLVSSIKTHGVLVQSGMKASLIQRSRKIIDNVRLQSILQEDISVVQKEITFSELIVEKEVLI